MSVSCWLLGHSFYRKITVAGIILAIADLDFPMWNPCSGTRDITAIVLACACDAFRIAMFESRMQSQMPRGAVCDQPCSITDDVAEGANLFIELCRVALRGVVAQDRLAWTQMIAFVYTQLVLGPDWHMCE